MSEKLLEFEAKSRVAEVMIFSEGARVTREVEMSSIPEISAEKEEVVVSVLGLSPFAHSPEVKFIAQCASDTLDIRHVSLREEEDCLGLNEGALDKVQAQLDEKRQRLQTLNAQIQSRRKQGNHLGSLAPSLQINGRNPRSKPSARMADVLALEAAIHQVVSESDQVLLQLWKEAQIVDEEIQSLETQLRGAEQRSNTEKVATKALKMAFVGRGKLQRLTITYSVDSARWWPGYAVKFSSGGKCAEMSMDAFVVQTSGEDWSAVQLKLSTSALNQDCRLPVLSSQRIGRAQSAKKSGFRSPPDALDELFSAWDSSELATQCGIKPTRTALKSLSVEDVFDDADDSSHPWQTVDDGDKFLSQLFIDEDKKEDVRPRLRRGGERRTVFCPECGAPRGECDCDQVLEEVLLPVPPLPVPMMSHPEMPGGGQDAVPVVARRSYHMVEDGCCAMANALPERPRSLRTSGKKRRSDQAFSEGQSVDKWMDFDGLILRDGMSSDKEDRGKLALREEKNSGRRSSEQAKSLKSIQQMTGPVFAIAPASGTMIGFDQVIASDGVFDIPSDATLHRIPMAAQFVQATQSLVAVPVEKLAVYREATLTNPFQMPLLPGPLDVMFDGTLLSTMALQTVDVGGTISVGLGEENRVQVVRNVKSMESTRGVLGGQTQVQTSVALEVRSFLAADVELTLFDRVPVSHSDDAKVTQSTLAPGTLSLSDEDRKRHVSGEGGLKWVLALGAGEKQTIKFEYAVTFSSKFELEGGNRHG